MRVYIYIYIYIQLLLMTFFSWPIQMVMISWYFIDEKKIHENLFKNLIFHENQCKMNEKINDLCSWKVIDFYEISSLFIKITLILMKFHEISLIFIRSHRLILRHRSSTIKNFFFINFMNSHWLFAIHRFHIKSIKNIDFQYQKLISFPMITKLCIYIY